MLEIRLQLKGLLIIAHTWFIQACCSYNVSLQVSGLPEEQLLVSLYPGLPTVAELFMLPDTHTSEHAKRIEEDLERVRVTEQW